MNKPGTTLCTVSSDRSEKVNKNTRNGYKGTGPTGHIQTKYEHFVHQWQTESSERMTELGKLQTIKRSSGIGWFGLRER